MPHSCADRAADNTSGHGGELECADRHGAAVGVRRLIATAAGDDVAESVAASKNDRSVMW